MRPCKEIKCEYRTTKKTKYGTYEWCKLCGCSVGSPKCECPKQEKPSKR